jgi:DNA-binding LytR/AlgR family response regulator
VLPTAEFLQVHKSFVVSKRHINKIEGNRITSGAYTIPIGKTYKSNVIALLKAQKTTRVVKKVKYK